MWPIFLCCEWVFFLCVAGLGTLVFDWESVIVEDVDVSSSWSWSCFCRLYVLCLWYRNFIAAYLCCEGWLDVYGMMVSVKVGFLNMDVFRPVGDLWVDMSK
jgi:hypothetical protein